jgi:transcriptional regulator with XRE-family HTH domain
VLGFEAMRKRANDDYGDGHFAERMRSVRLYDGFAQKEIAKEIEVSTRTIQAWESGETTPPAGESLRRLANSLRVAPGWLLSGQDDPRPKEDETCPRE